MSCDHEEFLAWKRKTAVDWLSCEPFYAIVEMYICEKCSNERTVIPETEIRRVRRERMIENSLYKYFGYEPYEKV